MKKLTDLLKAAVEKIFPNIPKCVGCGIEKGVDYYVCKKCAAELRTLEAGKVHVNGLAAVSIYKYDGIVKRIVKAYKYGNKKWMSQFMGDALCKAITCDAFAKRTRTNQILVLDIQTGVLGVGSTQSKVKKNKLNKGGGAKSLGDGFFKPFDEISCICYVPLHKKRRVSRGFDQAEELAKQVSKTTNIPLACALRRIKNTKTQTKLAEKERLENMKGAFQSIENVHGKVVLIDDVLTTGATTSECASVLREAGASNVCVLTFACSIHNDVR